MAVAGRAVFRSALMTWSWLSYGNRLRLAVKRATFTALRQRRFFPALDRGQRPPHVQIDIVAIQADVAVAKEHVQMNDK